MDRYSLIKNIQNILQKYNGQYENTAEQSSAIYDMMMDKKSMIQAQDQLLQFLNSLTDIFWQLNDKTEFTFISPSVKKILGFDPEYMIGKPVIEFIKEDQHELLKENIRARIQNKNKNQPSYREYLMKTKDGGFKPTEISSVSVFDDDGNLVGFTGITRDISLRKSMEQKLRESQAKFKSFMDHFPGATFIKKPDEELVFCNDVFAELMGKKPSDLVGNKKHIQFLSKELYQKYYEENKTIIRENKSITSESTFENADGFSHWLTIKFPLANPGKETLVGGLSFDITDRIEAEIKLKAEESKLQTLSQTAIELSLLDPETDLFEFIAKKAREIIGNRGMTLVSDFNVESLEWHIRATAGFNNLVQKISSILGKKLTSLKGYSNKDYLARLKDQKLVELGTDISAVSHGTITGSVAKKLFQLINFRHIYTISFFRETVQYGNLSLVLSEPISNMEKTIIESFIWQVSSILQTKVAVKSLHESEKKYRLLMENTGVGIGYYDLEGNIILFNKQAAENLGGVPDDFTGKNILELFGDKVGGNYLGRIKRVAKSTEPMQFEDEIKIGDEKKWFYSTYNSITDDHGHVVGVQIISHDITDKKLTELALITNEQRFTEIINHSDEVFYIHDTDHVIQYISPRCKDIFGFSEDEMMVQWTKLVTDNPINEIGYELTQKALQTGEKQKPYTLEIKQKQGKTKWIRVEESPIRDDSGEVTGIVGAIRDITDEKIALDALKESEERYRLLFEQSVDPNILMDGLTIINTNFATVKELGYDRKEDIIGLTPLDISPEYQPDGTLSEVKAQQLLNVANKNGYIHFEWLHLSKNGDPIWFDISLTRYVEGGNTRLHVIMRNINQSKIASEELQKINRTLEETGRIAKVGGWEFDVETGKGTWTDEVAKIHELDPGEPTSKELGISFYTPESREKITRAIDLLTTEGKPYDLELEMVTAKGNHKWVRTIGHPVYHNNKIVRAAGSFQDITEKKQYELEITKYRDHLEDLVQERTLELEKKNKELERMNNLFVGREFRIKELRDKIAELNDQIIQMESKQSKSVD